MSGAARDHTALLTPVESAVLRIVKEALGNVHQHSGATSASVEIRFLQRSVRILIADNGLGFEYSEPDEWSSHHLGVSGMRYRAEAIGGSFTLKSNPGNGTLISVELPSIGPA